MVRGLEFRIEGFGGLGFRTWQARAACIPGMTSQPKHLTFP